MESFDIDEFLNHSFKNLEQREKSKKKEKKGGIIKTEQKLQKKEEKDGKEEQKDFNINNDRKKDKKIIIEGIQEKKINIYNDNKIDMKIYCKMDIEETKNTKNISTKDFIKPLFPNEEIFEKEYTSDKVYIIDKFINANSNKTKNKKKKIKANYTHGLVKKLKKEKMNYNDLLVLNKMWQEYITELMNNSKNTEIILGKILKADLHGAILTVVNSTNKNNIGINGINLFESKRTFNILTEKNEIKIILKQGNIFEITLHYNNCKILINGDNFIYKSAERTKIKFKTKYNFNMSLLEL